MIVEIGQFSLILAFVTALLQAAAGLLPARIKTDVAATVASRAAGLQFILCLTAYASLSWAFIVSDFSVEIVVKNSHSYKPLLYKVSGVWGNHEGSMLLWVTLLAFFGFVIRSPINKLVIGIQGLLGAGFLSFLLFTSNPFSRISLPPVDGMGLNPVLQDPALALHPPLLYSGYVGFSVAFSFAIAALISGRVDRSWARQVKAWILLAWTSLSAGIALGSWWAYYELGWGGWWFWDPVENAALLPWLTGTALVHSIIVFEKREALIRWTILLCLLTFSLSMLGTFLVRSGVLSSVHAFALDPARGLYILVLTGLFTGGGLLLYGLRASRLTSDVVFAPLSRESALILNNLFLTAMAATVLTGTLYPLVMTVTGGPEISVGPPYFHATIIPLAIPLIVLMAAGPYLPWKKADLKAVTQRLQTALFLTLLILIVILAFQPEKLAFSLLGTGLAAWLVTTTLAEWAERSGLSKLSPGVWLRIKGMRAEGWGLTLAHAGLGVAIIGMIGTGLWTHENASLLHPGDTMQTGAYTLELEGVKPVFGPNYSALKAQVRAIRKGESSLRLYPETRYYPVSGENTAEASIRTNVQDDIYIVLGDRDEATGAWAINAWSHPGIAFLWLGFSLIVAGGVLGTTGAFAVTKQKKV